MLYNDVVDRVCDTTTDPATGAATENCYDSPSSWMTTGEGGRREDELSYMCCSLCL